MSDTFEPPFPEEQNRSDREFLAEGLAKLNEREAAQPARELDAKLDQANTSGNIDDIRSNSKLTIQFIQKFGPERWGQLTLKHDRARRVAQERKETQEALDARLARTTQGRIELSNRKRRETGDWSK